MVQLWSWSFVLPSAMSPWVWNVVWALQAGGEAVLSLQFLHDPKLWGGSGRARGVQGTLVLPSASAELCSDFCL